MGKRYARTLSGTRRSGVRAITRDLRALSTDTTQDLHDTEFWALKDVSFTLAKGEALGVMGLNGAGKSTLLRLVAGISKPDSGSVRVSGRVATLLDTGGFEPLETGLQAIQSSPVLWQVERDKLEEATRQVIEFAELGEYIHAPVRTYSKGMSMRLGFAISAIASPDLLLVDEVLAVGDIGFQHKCIDFFRRFLAQGGALIVVSHSTSALENLCTHGLLLDRGEAVKSGPVGMVSAVFSDLVLDREEAVAPEYSTSTISTPLSTDAFEVEDTSVELPNPSEGPSESEVGETVRPVLLDDNSPPRLLAPTHGRPIGFTYVTPVAKEGAFIRSNEPFTVEIGYRSTLPDVEVQCSVAIFTNDGHVALLTALSDDEDLILLSSGDGSITAQVDKAPLPPGHYLLRVAIIETATRQPLALHGWETPATRLHIAENDDSDPTQSVNALLVAPNVTWAYSSSEDASTNDRH